MRATAAATAMCFSIACLAAADNAGGAIRVRTNIPAQPLGAALESLAKERDFQVIYRSEVVGSLQTGGAAGELTRDEALADLLKGTGLTYRYLNNDTVTIVPLPRASALIPPAPERMKRTKWGMLGQALTVLTSGRATVRSAGPTTPEAPLKLEEVIVTATKRAQSLEKVPISVTAYTRETLDLHHVKEFADIARITPGVTVTTQTRGNTAGNNVSIRGISSGAGSATVGVYIDEAPVQIRPDSLSSSNPYPRLFDLDRVEILRGPQGTLFGAGSEGGTIRFITPDPSLERYSSHIRSEVSTTRHGGTSYEVGLAGGGPLVDDKLGFRLSGWHRSYGGYVDRISWVDQRLLDKDANSEEASVVRGALRFRPLDNLDIIASVFHQQVDIDDSSIYWEGYSDERSGRFISANPLASPTRDRFTLPALRITWDLGPVSLISNSAYLDRHNDNVFDNTTLSLAVFAGLGPLSPPPELADIQTPGFRTDHQHVFTEELRLQSNSPDSRLSWVIGAYYQHSNQSASNNDKHPYLDQELSYVKGYPVHVPLYQDTWLLYSVSSLTDEEKSLFGQVDYKLTDKWTLTAGVRIADHQYDNEEFSAGPVVGTLTGIASASRQSDTPVTPKFGVSYQANSDHMLYASAAKGYRQGSSVGHAPNNCAPDLAALGLTTDPREIRPDSVWSYEIGSKNRLLDGRLQLDGSIYRIDWTDIQSGLILPMCNVPVTTNFGDARSQGIDFSASWLATQRLSLQLAFNYADAEFTTTTSGTGGRVIRSAGQPLDIVPWKLSVSAQYDFAMLTRDAYVRIDDQYTSHDDTPLDLASAGTDATIPRAPSYHYLAARMGVKFGNWDVSLYATNLLNEHPEYGRYRDTSMTFNYRGMTVQPLTFGLAGVFRY